MAPERKRAACSAALAAVLVPLPVQADAGEHCVAAAGRHASSTYFTGEPYQLAGSQYRLADSGQFRLSDEARSRLGTSRCAGASRPAAAAAPNRLIQVPAYRPATGSGAYQALINTTAKIVGIQADLLHAVITVESAYNPAALSPKGAQGLMQLMPATAALYTVNNPFDPAQNVKAGARHLRYLLAEFDNDLALALAAYNAGAEAVRRYRNSIPPYPETRDYVQRVIDHYQQRLNRFPTTGS